jgi:hypothetical protein
MVQKDYSNAKDKHSSLFHGLSRKEIPDYGAADYIGVSKNSIANITRWQRQTLHLI